MVAKASDDKVYVKNLSGLKLKLELAEKTDKVATKMPVEIDEKRRAMWRTFLQTHTTVLCKLAREMQEAQNLPLTWYDVLAHLNDDPGGLRLQELAQAIVLSQSGLTRLLDRMEQAGLVARKPCPSDRRGAYALITAEGQAVLEQATPVYLRRLEEHFMQYLGDEEVEALHRALSKVLQKEMVC